MGLTDIERRAAKAEYQRLWSAANPARVKEIRAQTYARHQEKSKAATKAWADENRDRVKLSRAQHYQENRERIATKNAKWAKSNPDRMRSYASKYRESNPHISAAATSRRRVIKAQRTVSWDQELTELVALEAADLARLRKIHTGIAWHVDHVIPLRGNKVSGLHVWNNLAVIPAIENLRKNNRFEPEAA